MNFQSTCIICNQVVKSSLREGSQDVFKDWNEDLKAHIENCIATLKADLKRACDTGKANFQLFLKYRDEADQLKADLERERDANAKLREALEVIGNYDDGSRASLHLSHIARQALLAAKQDEIK